LDWLLLQAFRHGSYSVVGAETLEKSVAEAGEMAVFIIIATGSLRVSVLHSFQPLLLDWWLYSRHGGLSCLIMEAHSSARKSLPPAAGDLTLCFFSPSLRCLTFTLQPFGGFGFSILFNFSPLLSFVLFSLNKTYTPSITSSIVAFFIAYSFWTSSRHVASVGFCFVVNGNGRRAEAWTTVLETRDSMHK